MPSRVLRDYTDSLRFDGISAEAERLFIRLIMKADDYGRFHAEPRLLKAGCFPLHDNIRVNDLSRWLTELSNRQLILCYVVDGRKTLAVVNFGQRLRQSRARFPAPEGESPEYLPSCGNSPQLAAECGDFPPDLDSDSGLDSTLEGAGARESAAKKLTDGFDDFWSAYPKKVAKPEAQKAWTKHKCAEITAEIIAAVKKCAVSHDWKKELGQFIPHPATWLNRRGWEDELRPTNQPARENLTVPVTVL